MHLDSTTVVNPQEPGLGLWNFTDLLDSGLHDGYSERGSKKLNPEFSRTNGGGSTSVISTCCIELEMSFTENGMLHRQDKCGENETPSS